MNLNEIKAPKNSNKSRKRLGRGNSSGQGHTAGRGHKGQMSRSGATKRPWFEGGQMPLQRRIPKRGFTNFTRVEYQVVNLADLQKLEETEITAEVLKKHGLIGKLKDKTKLLGYGTLERSVTIKLDAVSASAKEKVEKAGGKIALVQADE